jgi:DNA-binding MarR family transcriptional regulator
MSRGLGEVQKRILDQVAKWEWGGSRSRHLGFLVDVSDKAAYRAVKSLQKRGFVYRVCGDGSKPKRQRVKRGKSYYTRYVCPRDFDSETRVKVTPAGLSYWAENVADTGII